MGDPLCEDLLDSITARAYLEKVGKGKHVPGSGSAAAFTAMLSASLVKTVTDICNREKYRERFAKVLPRINQNLEKIIEHIYPELERLHYIDSKQFDKVISARNTRNKAQNLVDKRTAIKCHVDCMKRATETPLKIGEFALELCRYADEIFKDGFQAARGDSALALNCALAALSGCISIIDLNLKDIPSDDWTINLRANLKKLRSRYMEYLKISQQNMIDLAEESYNQAERFQEFLLYADKAQKSDFNSDKKIEKAATDLLNLLWKQKADLWKNQKVDDLMIISPKKALKQLDFLHEEVETLGIHDFLEGTNEIAGVMESENRIVQISKAFPSETQRFTLAHELGHAVMHQYMGTLFREIPKDCISSNKPKREDQEYQADKFATYFLMPEKQVKRIFLEIFGYNRVVLDEDFAFALSGRSISEIKAECSSSRGFSRMIAGLEFYQGQPIHSLAKTFGVSKEAMAIRLEELNLVNY